MTFSPGQVVTVFRSRLRADGLEEYAATAARMDELARAVPGYVDHKAFTAEDGERVTVVTFADQASHDAWRSHAAAERWGRIAHSSPIRTMAAGIGWHPDLVVDGSPRGC